MAKVYYGVRFEPSLYSSFKVVAGASGCTVTGAFERFMRSCVEAGSLVFVERVFWILRLRHVFWLIGFVRVSVFFGIKRRMR